MATYTVTPDGVTQGQSLTAPAIDLTVAIAPADLTHAQTVSESVAIPSLNLSAGSAILPTLIGEATASFGVILAGDANLPALTGELTTGYQGAASLEALTGAGSFLTGGAFAGAGIFPALQGSGTATVPLIFAGDARLPAIYGSGGSLQSLRFAGDGVLPALKGSGGFGYSIHLAGDAQLPALIGDGALLVGALFAGEAALPALEGAGVYTLTEALAYLGWSTNTYNLGHGTYTNTEALGLGRLGARLYGAMDDGLYRMEGDDDEGVPIDAEWMLGFEDFGNEAVKAQRVAYLGLTSDGPVELLVRVDRAGAQMYTYAVERPHEDAEGEAPMRVKLGRGLKGRYWQMGMRNVDGSFFSLDRLGMGVWGSTRKR